MTVTITINITTNTVSTPITVCKLEFPPAVPLPMFTVSEGVTKSDTGICPELECIDVDWIIAVVSFVKKYTINEINNAWSL